MRVKAAGVCLMACRLLVEANVVSHMTPYYTRILDFATAVITQLVISQANPAIAHMITYERLKVPGRR